MRLDEFVNHSFPSKIKEIEWLESRNLISFQFDTKSIIYRLFEEIKSFKSKSLVWSPKLDQLAIVNKNEIEMYNLELDLISKHSVDITFCKWVEYLDYTLMLIASNEKLQIRLNGSFLIAETDAPQIATLDIIPESSLIVVGHESRHMILDCSAIKDNLSHYSVLSSQHSQLEGELTKLEPLFAKICSELKSFGSSGLKALHKVWEDAFAEHTEKPTMMHWKRLLAFGDYNDDSIQTLVSYLKVVSTHPGFKKD